MPWQITNLIKTSKPTIAILAKKIKRFYTRTGSEEEHQILRGTSKHTKDKKGRVLSYKIGSVPLTRIRQGSERGRKSKSLS